MNRSSWIPYCTVVTAALFSAQARAVQLIVDTNAGVTELSIDALPPLYPPFHTTSATVTEATLIDVGGGLLLMHWKENMGAGAVPYYTFSYDSGQNVSRVQRTSHVLQLRYAEFDPLVDPAPQVPTSLQGEASEKLYIVQFFTLALPELRQGVESLGATVRGFLPNNARIVELGTATPQQIAALDYVRWVGQCHPAYRVEQFIIDNLVCPSDLCPTHRYDIMVFERGLAQKTVVADRIQSIGHRWRDATYRGHGCV